jgi:hypothetical protein
MNSDTHDPNHVVTTSPERSQDGRAQGPQPNKIIMEIAKAIARRLAREEYDRRRLDKSGANADVSVEKPNRK